MSHRDCRDGDSGLAAGGDDLSLEFVAVLAAAPAQDGRLIFDSVHESTEKLSGLEAPMSLTGNQYGMAGCLLRTSENLEILAGSSKALNRPGIRGGQLV